jgi:heme-binding NEAT domain protein
VTEWASSIINVIANDTDPDGDYPLTLVAVSDPTGTAYVASSSEVGWAGNAAGIYTIQYTVQDARGATSTGTLQVTVNPSDCPPLQVCMF